MLSHFSLERFHPFDDRVRAAAAAGCAGIGWFVGDYLRLRDEGRSPAELRAVVDEHGICVAEIEVARGWGATDPIERQRLEPALWEMADTFAPRTLQAIGPRGGSVDQAVTGFARLCDAAAEHGVVVALEFLPFTDIATLDDALAIVGGADRPNGGLCLDLWHLVRGGDGLAALDRTPGHRVVAVQMSDGPAAAPTAGDDFDYRDDCLRNRRAPGTGEMDAVEAVRRLDALGVAVPWSLEVCNERAWHQPALPHVRRIADHMRAVLATAREET